MWISRANSRNKHMLNEQALLADLRKELPPGLVIDVVHLERMSLREQVEIFASARLVVFMRGAGTTNSVFLSPEAVVLYVCFGSDWEPLPLWKSGKLWFKIISHIPSSLSSNSNWSNHSLVPTEFLVSAREALRAVGFTGP